MAAARSTYADVNGCNSSSLQTYYASSIIKNSNHLSKDKSCLLCSANFESSKSTSIYETHDILSILSKLFGIKNNCFRFHPSFLNVLLCVKCSEIITLVNIFFKDISIIEKKLSELKLQIKEFLCHEKQSSHYDDSQSQRIIKDEKQFRSKIVEEVINKSDSPEKDQLIAHNQHEISDQNPPNPELILSDLCPAHENNQSHDSIIRAELVTEYSIPVIKSEIFDESLAVEISSNVIEFTDNVGFVETNNIAQPLATTKRTCKKKYTPKPKCFQDQFLPLSLENEIENIQQSSYSKLDFSFTEADTDTDVVKIENEDDGFLRRLLETRDLNLVEQELIIKEFGRLRSTFQHDKTKTFGVDFRNEIKIWDYISSFIRQNSEVSSLVSSEPQISSFDCYNYIKMIANESVQKSQKFLTWKANSLTSGVIELKIPLLSLPILSQDKILDSPSMPILSPQNIEIKTRPKRKYNTSAEHKRLKLERLMTKKPRPPTQIYECDGGEGCSLKFKSITLLIAHLRTHKGPNYYMCKVRKCSHKRWTTPLALRIHERVHEEENKKFSCSKCDLKFLRKYNLSSHMRQVHDPVHAEKDIPCSFCDEKFTKNVHLESHLVKVHGDEHPELKKESHKCKICNTYYATKGYLRFHMMGHTNDLPYSCSHCPFKTYTPDYLARHERKHSTERTFQCSLCPLNYKHSSQLKYHLQVHEGSNRKYPCDLCDKVFVRANKLKIHKDSVHFPEPRYICPLCGKNFPVLDRYRFHFNICSKKPKVI